MDSEDDDITAPRQSNKNATARCRKSPMSNVTSQQARYWRHSLWSVAEQGNKNAVFSHAFLKGHTQPWSITVHEPLTHHHHHHRATSTPPSSFTQISKTRVNYMPTVVQPGVFFVRASREHVARILNARRLGQMPSTIATTYASMPELFDPLPFGVMDFQAIRATTTTATNKGRQPYRQWSARTGLDVDEVACAIRSVYDQQLIDRNVLGARTLPKLEQEDYTTSTRPLIKMSPAKQWRYEHLWRAARCGMWLSTASLITTWGDFWLQHLMRWYVLLFKSFQLTNSDEIELVVKALDAMRDAGERAQWLTLNLLDVQALECASSRTTLPESQRKNIVPANVDFWHGYEALLRSQCVEIRDLADWPERIYRPHVFDPRALIPSPDYLSKVYDYDRPSSADEQPLEWIGLVRSLSHWASDYDVFALIQSLWRLNSTLSTHRQQDEDGWRRSRIQTLSVRLNQWVQDTMELLRTMHAFDLKLYDDTERLMRLLRHARSRIDDENTQSAIHAWSTDVLVVRCARLALRQWQALIHSFNVVWHMVVNDILSVQSNEETLTTMNGELSDMVSLFGERIDGIDSFVERHFPPIEHADDFGEAATATATSHLSDVHGDDGDESTWATRQRETSDIIEQQGRIGSNVYTYGASRGMRTLSQTADSLHRLRRR